MIRDLSDKCLIEVFGDIMHELPELFHAIRHFEMQNRPRLASGGFNLKADWVSVERFGGNVSRIRVGNARSME